MKRIYLDHNAATPTDPRVIETMRRWWTDCGNPSSLHAEGRAARRALEDAREHVAALIDAHPAEIVFTSGATESNVLALRGVTAAAGPRRIVVSAIEHPCVLDAAEALAADGFEVARAPVHGDGRLDVDVFAQLLATPAAGAAVMAANNETGALQPIVDAAALCARAGARLHVDAAQMPGKAPFTTALE
ncbi:MAG TPA: aminotransferase class V-fold PLP-dependent enzyme, partial [Planctomycetota bacterium]|nr:aminotransferase class V-fold PLP-dependent enzyme [Planctomycetota bacterium]